METAAAEAETPARAGNRTGTNPALLLSAGLGRNPLFEMLFEIDAKARWASAPVKSI